MQIYRSILEITHMKRIAMCLDYDGCICTTAYVFPFTPENVKDIKTNTSIIDINIQLWDFILELCKENPNLEFLTLVHFSARQNARTDAINSFQNESESYYLAMEKIFCHVTNFLKSHGINIRVNINYLLMPDIYHNREHGYTFKKAVEDIDYTLQGRGIINCTLSDDDFLYDDSKVSFVFAHVHAIEAEVFYYLDDRLDICSTIKKFYGNPVGSSLIPSDVKIILCHYDDGNLKKPPICEINGTGEKCHRYANILQSINKKEKSNLKILPNTYDKNIEQSIKSFYKIYQEHVYEDLLKLTPLQNALSDTLPILNNSREYEFDLALHQETQSSPLQKSLLSGFIGFWEPKIASRKENDEEPKSNKQCNII